MPIPFRCPGCGKEYQVDEKMAGRQAKCRCGATTRIPAGDGGVIDEPLDDWVAAAFRPPVAAPPVPEPKPPATPKPMPPMPPLVPAVDRPEPKRRRKPKPSRWHKPVGVASIVYGALAALVLLGLEILSFPNGIMGWTADVVLAVAIAVGGVLILKHHEHGPACAGLGSIFLCFFSAWGVILWRLPMALSAGEYGVALVLVAFFVIAYSVPIGIVVWCLREETERQKREAEEEL
jgi:hypothetical protein